MDQAPEEKTPSEFSLEQIHTLWFEDGALPSANPEATIKVEREDSEPEQSPTGTARPSHGQTQRITTAGASVILRSNRMVKIESGQVHDAPELGDYELGGTIGQGGMGVVLAARQSSLDRRVAVKMILPGRDGDGGVREKFILEALTTGSLEHPNIVPVYELGQDETGKLFYAMREVKGRTWRAGIKQRSEKENIETLRQVGNAVASAHAKGILHRDIKTENVMLGDYGEVLLMDWGLAVGMRTGVKAPPITPANALAGTPAYMAPEMARGDANNIGPWSDQYLLGAMLFEILVGKPPHPGSDLTTCLGNAANNVTEPTDRRDEWMDVALRAMHFNPVKRYPSVKAFLAAVANCQAHSESLELSRRAAEWAEEAKEKGDYDHYSRAVMGFEQALELWDENEAARRDGDALRLEYADTALKRGDYDLSLSLLAKADSAPAQEIIQRAAAGKRERDNRRRLVRWLGLAAVALLVVTAVVAGGATIIVSRQARAERAAREESEQQRALAEERRVEAEQQRSLAEAQRIEADNQRDRAEIALGEAERQRVLAEERRNQAEEALRAAEAARKAEAEAMQARLREEEARVAAQTEARQAAEEALAAREVVQRMGYLEDNTRWRLSPEQAIAQRDASAQERGVPSLLEIPLDTLQAEFAWVPPGEFVMGSSPREPLRSSEEHLHEVRLTRPFYIGRREVTRGQWRALIGVEEPGAVKPRESEMPAVEWRFRPLEASESTLPATGISHNDVTELLLPALAKHVPEGYRVRLPSEAEWEWAARAGATTAYSGGDGVTALAGEGWYEENSGGMSHPTGAKTANAWGLFDVSGNAAEIVADSYDSTFYLSAPENDPLCQTETPMRVVRGGSFVSMARHCRLAARNYVHKDNRHQQVGVRLVIEPK